MTQDPETPDDAIVETVRVRDAEAMTIPTSEGRALATLGGVAAALATMTEEEFETNVRTMQIARDRMRRIKEAILIPGKHYGMPGAKTPEEIAKAARNGQVGLYKAGAEVVLDFFSLVAGEPKIEITRGDPTNTSSPTFEMHARVPIHRGDANGPVVAVGIGAWSTWETKNRYRWTKRVCPKCKADALVMQKEARGGEFKGKAVAWCAPRQGGCNAEFLQSDPEIAGQKPGKVANAEAADLLNTGVKMSKKRAMIDGTISATGLSEIFTQDVEDLSPEQMKQREADVEAAVSGMYDGDPDAWRNQEAGAAQAGAATTRTTAPQEQRKPNGDVATAAQIKYLRDLADSRGLSNIDAWLRERGLAPVAELTKAAAAVAIGSLKALPEAKPAGPVDPPQAKEPPKKSTGEWGAKKVDQMLARLKELLRTTNAREQRETYDVRNGVWFVTGSIELGHLGVFDSDAMQLDYLTPEQMISLGSLLAQRATTATEDLPR